MNSALGRQLISRNHELQRVARRWRAFALLFATLLLVCVIVIVLQYLKLPPP